MLSSQKLNRICRQRNTNAQALAGHLTMGGRDDREAAKAIRNWQKGLFKPRPSHDDVSKLANALGVEENSLKDWRASYKYAPLSASKARLVTQLIVGQPVQDAMDLLKFTRKRAAPMVGKLLKCALADADEQQASVDNLYVKEARVDDAGRRLGTKTWIAKDRGRAHPIKKSACHIHVVLTEE